MTRRLVGTYLVLAAILLIALVIPLGLTFADNQRGDLSARVERDAFTLASLGRDSVADPTPAQRQDLWAIARRYQLDTGGRVVLVDARGRLIADSNEPGGPGVRRSFASRPEIQKALAGGIASGERFSNTLGQNLLLVAVPVASSGRVLGAVRITFPTDELDADTRRYWLLLAAITLVGMAAVGAIGFVLARTVTGPLQRLRQSAAALGRGELFDARGRGARPTRGARPGGQLRHDGRAARDARRVAARVRGRRLAPAANAPRRPPATAREPARGGRRGLPP